MDEVRAWRYDAGLVIWTCHRGHLNYLEPEEEAEAVGREHQCSLCPAVVVISEICQ